MNIAELIKARQALIQEILNQAGRRLSAETIRKLQEINEKLTELLGGESTTEEEVEQAVSAIPSLLQEVVTGKSIEASYEVWLSKLGSALDADKNMPSGYKYIIATMPEGWVVFAISKWRDEKYTTTYYQTTFTESDGKFTFSDTQEIEIIRVVKAINQAAEGAPNLQQEKTQTTKPPFEDGPVQGYLGQTADGQPFLCQQSRLDIDLVQEVGDGSGMVEFSGTATVGDVINSRGQVYPKELWQSQVALIQSDLAAGKHTGSSGHPKDGRGNPRNPEPHELAVKFTEMLMQDNKVKFKAVTIPTQLGQDLAAVLRSGVALEMSTRATGKTKKGKFAGKTVDLVQTDGFTWYGTDVVVAGASPGSTIDNVKLQSHDGERTKETQPMNWREILKKLNQARADGDTEKVALLQAELEKALEQEATGGTLSDSDRTLMKQAIEASKAAAEAAKTATEAVAALNQEKADREVAHARDEAAKTAADTLIQEKKLDPKWRQTFINHACRAAKTADEVALVQDGILEDMKPLIQEAALIQQNAPGVMIAEWNEDGTAKAPPTTWDQAVQEVVHSAVQRGLFQDTGEQTLSNPAFVVRKMVESQIDGNPYFADCYIAKRHGLLQSVDDVAKVMHMDRTKFLNQDLPTGMMAAANITVVAPNVLGMITEIYPQLIATLFAIIQPITKSNASIYYQKHYDEDDNLISDVTNFTGSYANNNDEHTLIKKLHFGLTEESISLTRKKLGWAIPIQTLRHIMTDFNIDASQDLASACASAIAREWNYNTLMNIRDGATAGDVHYGTIMPNQYQFDQEQWQKQFPHFVLHARSKMWNKRACDTTYIFGDSDSIDKMTRLTTAVGQFTTNGRAVITEGVNIVGTLTTGEVLVKVQWWNTLCPNQLIVCGKGSGWKTGYVFAPYQSLYVSPQHIDTDYLDASQAMLSEAGAKMVDGNYFARIIIDQGVEGSPLDGTFTA